MKTFLQELVEKMISEHTHPEKHVFIFPNRRASLYFRREYIRLLKKPVFSPGIVTIENFFAGFSSLYVPDKLELTYYLYKVYQKIVGVREPFEHFFFWGEMLLRDFDEVDKYLINPEHLFKDLSFQKELDQRFDYLTEEQQKFLQQFWGAFESHPSESKKKFSAVWSKLLEVYQSYGELLASKGLGYEGMQHRDVINMLSSGGLDSFLSSEQVHHFVGFNALTAVEEKLISYFVLERGAQVHWDLDEYYVNNKKQEAGEFFRTYQEHSVLGRTFSPEIPANFRRDKSIQVFGASQHNSQVKLMAEVLDRHLEGGANPEEILVVLPDEKLLFPALHSLAGRVSKFNVTMGFPISQTPLFNLVEMLIELQIHAQGDCFYHRQVTMVLNHPYSAAADSKKGQQMIKEIQKTNWIRVEGPWLRAKVALHELIFHVIEPTHLLSYLRDVIKHIAHLPKIKAFDKEYAFHFLTFFNKVELVLGESIAEDSSDRKGFLKSFLKMIKQLMRSIRIPFSGEPLEGLQVMGVLETRNIDFKHIFVLSLNEGVFPASQKSSSYIPYNIRKAYSMPTFEHQDAIYAYLFYRIIQRAENVFLFHNSETDVLGQGERSRYLQQLLFEGKSEIKTVMLHNPLQPKPIQMITIPKDSEIQEAIKKLNFSAKFQGISPSALNTYMECRLKFYFQKIAGIKEADEVEEDMDARVLGNFLHDVMENFYRDIVNHKRNNLIEESDFVGCDEKIEGLLNQILIKTYRLNPKEEVVYKGQRLIVKHIVFQFAQQILMMDKARVPFYIEGVEEEGLTYAITLPNSGREVIIGGKIDRVDRKGDELRVVDYKTGRDKLTFPSIASLFERDGKRNKAVFQTLLYALLYQSKANPKWKIVPGLINRTNIFGEGFEFGLKMGRQTVEDARDLLPEFEARLKIVLEELFDPDVPFDQTHVLETCNLCPYQRICYR